MPTVNYEFEILNLLRNATISRAVTWKDAPASIHATFPNGSAVIIPPNLAADGYQVRLLDEKGVQLENYSVNRGSPEYGVAQEIIRFVLDDRERARSERLRAYAESLRSLKPS